MLDRPVALVTGGSRGIGRAICLDLARLGYAVAINYTTNEAAARETQTALGPETASLILQADVSVTNQREALVDAVLGEWDRIDVLVNNAGVGTLKRGDLLEATEESWDRVLG